MNNFNEIFPKSINVTQNLRRLLNMFYDIIIIRPYNLIEIKNSLLELVEYLCTNEGRTDNNCRAVDHFIFTSEKWEKEYFDLPDSYTDILNDMCEALHDTVSAPEIAINFDSTPEQLLYKIKAL